MKLKSTISNPGDIYIYRERDKEGERTEREKMGGCMRRKEPREKARKIDGERD